MARAGRLWEDVDFSTLKLDRWGIDTEVLGGDKKAKRILRAWKESWEDEETKKADPVVEARLVRKYGGLQWNDPDNVDRLTTSHPYTQVG